jgi:hypothetical protein
MILTKSITSTVLLKLSVKNGLISLEKQGMMTISDEIIGAFQACGRCPY